MQNYNCTAWTGTCLGRTHKNQINGDSQLTMQFTAELNTSWREADEQKPTQFSHADYHCPTQQLKTKHSSTEHVPLYNVANNLTPQQAEDLHSMIYNRFKMVWDFSPKDGLSYPKACKCVTPIDTDPEDPRFFVKPYRQSIDKIQYIHKCCELLERAGIIEKLPKGRNCKCCSSLLAVPKPRAPANVLRMAHDHRPLNKKTLP